MAKREPNADRFGLSMEQVLLLRLIAHNCGKAWRSRVHWLMTSYVASSEADRWLGLSRADIPALQDLGPFLEDWRALRRLILPPIPDDIIKLRADAYMTQAALLTSRVEHSRRVYTTDCDIVENQFFACLEVDQRYSFRDWLFCYHRRGQNKWEHIIIDRQTDCHIL